MKLKKPNFKLMWKIFRRIESNPDFWDQSTWHCGTTHCFAGHVTLDAIERSKKTQEYLKEVNVRSKDKTVLQNLKNNFAEKFLLDTRFKNRRIAENHSTFELARMLLGLTESEMETLTASDNSLDKIKRVITKLEKKYERAT